MTFGNRAFAGVKDEAILEQGGSLIHMTGVLIKKGKHTQGDCHVEIRVMLPPARNYQKLEERTRTDASLTLQREHGPANTWVPDFWPPEL